MVYSLRCARLSVCLVACLLPLPPPESTVKHNRYVSLADCANFVTKYILKTLSYTRTNLRP